MYSPFHYLQQTEKVITINVGGAHNNLPPIDNSKNGWFRGRRGLNIIFSLGSVKFYCICFEEIKGNQIFMGYLFILLIYYFKVRVQEFKKGLLRNTKKELGINPGSNFIVEMLLYG
jgi:hypothetical protein